MTHLEQHDHMQARRNTILFTLCVVVVTMVATLAAGWLVGNRTREETNRAQNALIALEQACDQVARLGGRCVTPPSQVRDTPLGPPGPPGANGPPGRPPTQAEIAAAVAAYLAQHPPAAGPQGKPGLLLAPVSGCPLLGYHFATLTVRLVGAAKSQQILACVPDQR